MSIIGFRNNSYRLVSGNCGAHQPSHNTEFEPPEWLAKPVKSIMTLGDSFASDKWLGHGTGNKDMTESSLSSLGTTPTHLEPYADIKASSDSRWVQRPPDSDRGRLGKVFHQVMRQKHKHVLLLMLMFSLQERWGFTKCLLLSSGGRPQGTSTDWGPRARYLESQPGEQNCLLQPQLIFIFRSWKPTPDLEGPPSELIASNLWWKPSGTWKQSC